MNETFLTAVITIALFVIVFLPYVVSVRKKRRHFENKKREAISLGHNKPVAQHPLINQSRCIGCSACVIACPEHALGMIDGIADLVYPGKCVGHGICAEACPVSGIQIVLDSTKSTAELPQLSESYESSIPNLYLIGELGGMALIRNAIFQGRTVSEHIAEKSGKNLSRDSGIYDIVIVGAGPAGLSAALAAKAKGLRYLVLEKEESPGGAILSYPRQKLVMTTPVEIPEYGVLRKREVSKEELLTIWTEIVQKTGLQVSCGERLEDVKSNNGLFIVTTSAGHEYRGHHVVLALGRRGTPRKLDVPGETTSKVAYQLLEAVRYKHTRCIVVGAGDSAIEAAIALSKQVGTTVTVINRGLDFNRAKPKNRERIADAEKKGSIKIFFKATVQHIRDKTVDIQTPTGPVEVGNDFVFIFAGGELPTPFLKKIGIAFLHKEGVIAA